jgi:hypothetical protein
MRMRFRRIDGGRSLKLTEECKSKSKSEIQGSFATLRMTTVLPIMQRAFNKKLA